MVRLCNDYGVDTIETGTTIAVAMQAGVIPFGDGKGAINLIHEFGRGPSLGRILGSGTDITGRVYGLTHVPTVKGQSMPAYEPRAIKGIGITYATTTMGADHTAGYTICVRKFVGGLLLSLRHAPLPSNSGMILIPSHLKDELNAFEFQGVFPAVSLAKIARDISVQCKVDPTVNTVND